TPRLPEEFWAAERAWLAAGGEGDRERSARKPGQQQCCLICGWPVAVDADQCGDEQATRAGRGEALRGGVRPPKRSFWAGTRRPWARGHERHDAPLDEPPDQFPLSIGIW